MTIKTNQIKEIKIASNRFNVNVIIPNQDKNAKCNIYVSSEQGINDLFIIASAELDARNKSMVANKKGVIAKNGDLYKSNLKSFDMLFLSERDNRTFLNAIRRLADNPKYSKENCLEMINSEFGKKQNFVNPNTLLNKVDKYFEKSPVILQILDTKKMPIKLMIDIFRGFIFYLCRFSVLYFFSVF